MTTRSRLRSWAAVAAGLAVAVMAVAPASASDAEFAGVDEVLVADSAGSGGAVFTDLQISTHDGFDRVVWEFAGTGEPGWFVEYSDDPREAGRGFRIRLDGDADLGVFLRGVSIPGSPGLPPDAVPYEEPFTPVPGVDTVVVTEVYPGLTFESQQDSFVGLTHEVPFRVYRLSDPPRVVVELEHADPLPATTTPAEQVVDVYYGVGDGTDCTLVAPFERTVTGDGATEDLVLETLDALVAGPTPDEADAGASSFFSADTAEAVLDVDLTDGRLLVHLADIRQLIPGASSSCGSGQLLSELNTTVFQFPEVQTVSYAFEESVEVFCEFVQIGGDCAFERPAEPTPTPATTTGTPTPTPTSTPTAVPTAVPAGGAGPDGGGSGSGAVLWVVGAGLAGLAGVAATVALRSRRS